MTGPADLPRLSRARLGEIGVRAPAYDVAALRAGIVHLGVGAFHRAHQAVYTDEALAGFGGDWGVVGVALRRPDAPAALTAQDNLYVVETLAEQPSYRVVGALTRTLHGPGQPEEVLAALGSPNTHVVTLTVTEKGYALGADGGLDLAHPDVAHDLSHPGRPRSAVGWLCEGLVRRARLGGTPLTVISCDNVSRNGGKLGRAVAAFLTERAPDLAGWLADSVAFPDTMVDCIVPATTQAVVSRVAEATGLYDPCCVQREAFSQWVIQDRFAGPRPRWEEVGVELAGDVAPHERLKLHVLNASHSALAYLGLARGFTYVHEAIADPDLGAFLDAMAAEEIAPALAPLDVPAYWRTVRRRFANPMLGHSLAQIACDGSEKLSQRILPLIVDNARHGRPTTRLARVVRAWLDFAARGDVVDPRQARLREWRMSGARVDAAIDDDVLFPDPFRTEPAVRSALEIRS